MIESLTKSQESAIPSYVEKWLSIGLSTERMDREAAIAAAKKAYRLVGLDEPVNFHFTRSPIEAIELIQKLDPNATKSDILSNMIYGAHDASWLGFYDFFGTECGIRDCDKMEGLSDLARNCGWLSVFEDTVVFQEKPIAIRFDDQDRLHCETGPAIEYEDGFAVYSWHGVSIPKEWITERDKLTANTALTWENIEQRRAACEIVTWAKVLREMIRSGVRSIIR